jgi:hypothetical protein
MHNIRVVPTKAAETRVFDAPWRPRSRDQCAAAYREDTVLWVPAFRRDDIGRGIRTKYLS